MSASLVGSEMCIRDSRAHGLAHLGDGHGLGRDARRQQHRGPVVVDVAPVSYTHLTLPTICSV
eukprot:1222720-Alexandrium_andersonii.AAC.1